MPCPPVRQAGPVRHSKHLPRAQSHARTSEHSAPRSDNPTECRQDSQQEVAEYLARDVTTPSAGRSGKGCLSTATHTGEAMMGVAASGQTIHFGVHARGRFVGGNIADRWDRADFEDIMRRRTGPTH